eukprot:CAMPEP_0201591762 /NCGR_PEP_ID=MMETSP0190_2-20130828/189839_1 /ASSEMBLY_ACC=CAM_ASM_000263 /TAXON_ID=37353 /ORGANISM="Rosalina sp." /LENGTH=948 /DNA_ID=CAMNT_0048050223 /DNA_START=114 /DNA_END=2963 /DNA_ORIENTATION=+
MNNNWLFFALICLIVYIPSFNATAVGTEDADANAVDISGTSDKYYSYKGGSYPSKSYPPKSNPVYKEDRSSTWDDDKQGPPAKPGSKGPPPQPVYKDGRSSKWGSEQNGKKDDPKYDYRDIYAKLKEIYQGKDADDYIGSIYSKLKDIYKDQDDYYYGDGYGYRDDQKSPRSRGSRGSGSRSKSGSKSGSRSSGRRSKSGSRSGSKSGSRSGGRRSRGNGKAGSGYGQDRPKGWDTKADEVCAGLGEKCGGDSYYYKGPTCCLGSLVCNKENKCVKYGSDNGWGKGGGNDYTKDDKDIYQGEDDYYYGDGYGYRDDQRRGSPRSRGSRGSSSSSGSKSGSKSGGRRRRSGSKSGSKSGSRSGGRRRSGNDEKAGSGYGQDKPKEWDTKADDVCAELNEKCGGDSYYEGPTCCSGSLVCNKENKCVKYGSNNGWGKGGGNDYTKDDNNKQAPKYGYGSGGSDNKEDDRYSKWGSTRNGKNGVDISGASDKYSQREDTYIENLIKRAKDEYTKDYSGGSNYKYRSSTWDGKQGANPPKSYPPKSYAPKSSPVYKDDKSSKWDDDKPASPVKPRPPYVPVEKPVYKDDKYSKWGSDPYGKKDDPKYDYRDIYAKLKEIYQGKDADDYKDNRYSTWGSSQNGKPEEEKNGAYLGGILDKLKDYYYSNNDVGYGYRDDDEEEIQDPVVLDLDRNHLDQEVEGEVVEEEVQEVEELVCNKENKCVKYGSDNGWGKGGGNDYTKDDNKQTPKYGYGSGGSDNKDDKKYSTWNDAKQSPYPPKSAPAPKSYPPKPVSPKVYPPKSGPVYKDNRYSTWESSQNGKTEEEKYGSYLGGILDKLKDYYYSNNDVGYGYRDDDEEEIQDPVVLDLDRNHLDQEVEVVEEVQEVEEEVRVPVPILDQVEEDEVVEMMEEIIIIGKEIVNIQRIQKEIQEMVDGIMIKLVMINVVIEVKYQK